MLERAPQILTWWLDMPKPSLDVPIPDRVAAGRALAELLAGQGGPQTLVLALPRGGVPVAFEVAQALDCPLDLMLVRKLGVPGHSELAMGAIASGGVRVLNEDILRSLGIGEAETEAVERREAEELARRERVYRGARPAPELRDRQVILVDDGIATGATMRAAVQAVRKLGAARITVAVPVGAQETLTVLRHEADEVVCPLVPEPLSAIGRWYRDFSQTSDAEVIDLLRRAWERPSA